MNNIHKYMCNKKDKIHLRLFIHILFEVTANFGSVVTNIKLPIWLGVNLEQYASFDREILVDD